MRTLNYLCIIALFFPKVAPAQEEHGITEPRFAALLKLNEAQQAQKADAPYEIAIQTLSEKLSAALERERQSAIAAGNLGLVTVIMEEQKALEAGAYPPETIAPSEKIAKFRQVWNASEAESAAKKRHSSIMVTTGFGRKLDALVKTLTQEKNINEALKIRAYREELAKSLAIEEAAVSGTSEIAGEPKKMLPPIGSKPVKTKPKKEMDPMEIIYTAMKIHYEGQPELTVKKGEIVEFEYSLKNTSDETLEVPVNKDFSRPMFVVGSLQKWIKREGRDDSVEAYDDRDIPRAKDEHGYGDGGSVTRAPEQIEPSGEIPQRVKIETEPLPEGLYTYTIEYKELYKNSGSPTIELLTIEITVIE